MTPEELKAHEETDQYFEGRKKGMIYMWNIMREYCMYEEPCNHKNHCHYGECPLLKDSQ